MTNDTALLPAGFDDLEPYLATWDLPNFDERRLLRGSLPMEAIQRFYDGMTVRAEAALDHLDQFSLDNMPQDTARLYRLILALAHASIAIEVTRAPHVPFASFPDDFSLTRDGRPF